jgi:hypothetical protein
MLDMKARAPDTPTPSTSPLQLQIWSDAALDMVSIIANT